jgi:hypothetical protein
MTSFISFVGTGSGGIICETDPICCACIASFNYLKELKRFNSIHKSSQNPPVELNFVSQVILKQEQAGLNLQAKLITAAVIQQEM